MAGMGPMMQLRMMLTGSKRKKAPDAKEEAAEKRAGIPSNPKEEALEDPKGRPLNLRFSKKKGR